MHIFIVFLFYLLLFSQNLLPFQFRQVRSWVRASSRGIQKRAITSVNQAILAEKYQAEPKILKNTSNQQKTKFKKKLSKKNKKKVLLPEEKNGKTSQLFIIIIYINFIIITIFIPTFAFKNLAHNLSFAYNTFLSALFASELQPSFAT